MEFYVGQIIMFGGNFAIRGFAECNGQLLAISSNSALFSILGTTYGGDGRTTFGLPDLRGRVAIHAGNGPGLSDYRLGAKGGTESVTLTTNQIPSHNHTFALGNGPGTVASGNQQHLANVSLGETIFTSADPAATALKSNAITSQGGGQSHTNIQPFTVITYEVALQGIYPSRN